MQRPQTLGELKRSGYRPRTVRQELRANLIAKLRTGEPVFPGLVGYDRTVVPQVQNAILSGHDFILLGLRGQAKTRLLRSLPALLDDAIPAIAGSPLNEDPLAPATDEARRRIAEEGDALPIVWIARAERYREKLATPDVTIADLIGDIDPIKAATKKLSFADPEVVH
jgi:magnesium chelatase subunit I